MLENRSFDSLLGWLYEKSDPALNIPPAAEKDRYRGLQNLDSASFTNTALGGSLSSPPLRGAAGFTVPSVDPGEEFQHVNMQVFESATPQPGAPVTQKGYLADFVAVMKAKGFADDVVQRRAREVMQSYTPGSCRC